MNSYLKQDNVDQHYLVWIKLQPKLSFVMYFTISKSLKKWHYLVSPILKWLSFPKILFLFRFITSLSACLKQMVSYKKLVLEVEALRLVIWKCRYSQIAKHWFLVAWNGIKIRCSNTVFIVTLENLCEFEVNFYVLS